MVISMRARRLSKYFLLSFSGADWRLCAVGEFNVFWENPASEGRDDKYIYYICLRVRTLDHFSYSLQSLHGEDAGHFSRGKIVEA